MKVGLLITIIFLLACGKNGDMHYEEEKLVDVTIDLYVASETLRRIEDERADSLRMLYNTQIETIHNIELEKYESDIAKMKLKLEDYVAFHQIVRDSIIALEKRTKNRKRAPSRDGEN